MDFNLKLYSIYKSMINEDLYHGSKREKLEWDKRYDHIGSNMLGFGIYLTDNKDEANIMLKKIIKVMHTFIRLNQLVLIYYHGWKEFHNH